MDMSEPTKGLFDHGKRKTLRAGRKQKFLTVSINLEALALKKIPAIWGVGPMITGTRIKEKWVVVKDKKGKSSPCLFLGGNTPTPKREVFVVKTNAGARLERIIGAKSSEVIPLTNIRLVFKVKEDGAPFKLHFVDVDPLDIPLKP